MSRFIYFLLGLLFLSHSSLFAGQTKHRYPMTTTGTYITAYLDHDSAKSQVKDWNGGTKTYDGHGGSDYGVGGFTGMDQGVDVLASADGTVVAVVDGYSDRCTSGTCSPCNGNYVKIQHSDGKFSFYLHLKKGSLTVQNGQTIQCGQKVGQVGSSGCSTGPHLHFQINNSSGVSEDPFTNDAWVSKGNYLGHPATQCMTDGSTTPVSLPCSHVQTMNLGTSNLNIRQGASTSFAIVDKVANNICLELIGIDYNGQNVSGNATWYQIKYNGITGWISAYYAQCSSCGGTTTCTNGATQTCYSGASSTQNKGVCKEGTQTCSSGSWGNCQGEIIPSTEICDGKDNNCDGQIDEGCNCTDGQTKACGSSDVGECKMGTQTCSNGNWGSCVGEVKSTTEICDGKDNDCDGVIDEGCACTHGQTKACGNDQGECRAGTMTCNNGVWGTCVGEVKATSELCDGKDNDCDGQIDEGNPEGGRACSSASNGCAGTFLCQSGQLLCVASTQPTAEICDGKDNVCDGQIDENVERSCYTGSPNTNGVGECKGGKQLCVNGSWGLCQGEIVPSNSDACGDNKDNNCNGQIDEGCTQPECKENELRDCYTGPANTQDKGICKKGQQTCVGGKWTTCLGQVLPETAERCGDKIDNNCNGQIDENCSSSDVCEDKDKDGYGVGPGCKEVQDCNDNDPSINPGKPEICGNNKDDDCQNGDLVCGKIQLGEKGCNKSEDCDSNLCAKLSGEQRCTKACQTNEECPKGFTCVDKQACWPEETQPIPSSDFVKPCTSAEDCPANQQCEKGFCKESSGCGCSTENSPQPASFSNLLFLFLLGFLFFMRRRR